MSRVEISKKLVLINSGSSAVTLVLNLVVLVWLQQYLIQRISPEEYALLPLVMSLMAFSPLVTIVLSGGIGRYVTAAYARGDDKEVTSICSTMLPLLAACGMLLAVVCGFLAWHVDSLLKIAPAQLWDARLMFGLASLTLCIRLPLSVFGSGIIVRQKFMLADMINIASQLLRFIVLFALLFGVSTNVLWVVLASQVAEIVSLSATTWVSLRLVPSQRFSAKSISLSLGLEVLGYGSWNLVEQAAKTAREALDPLLLNHISSALEVSTLYVAGIAPRQMSTLLGPITRPFFPILTAFHATGDTVRLRNTYLRTARYHCWVLLTVAVPAAIFAERVMSLYLGGKYPSAGSVMALLVFVPVFQAFNALGEAVAMAMGEAKGLALRKLMVLVVSIPLSYLFIVRFKSGAIGAAFGALVTVGVVEAFTVWPYCRKLTQTSTGEWLREVVAPTALPAIVPACFCWYFSSHFALDNWISIFAISGLSAVLYWVVLKFTAFRPQDRADLQRLAEKFPRFRRILMWL